MSPRGCPPWAGIAAVCLLAAGCSSLATNRSSLPAAYTLVQEPLVIHSDFPLPVHHRLVQELGARRSDVLQRLALPSSDEPIHIYLFETADRFEAFVKLHHPQFPERRAFFLETDTRLQVYAQWGDRVAEDLRHEVTHGYLHAVVPRLPLWLDEGLAEFFEVPRGQRGLNRAHLDNLAARLKDGQWTPNLARLESLPPSTDMSLEDYAESWAWTYCLLESHPAHRELLCQYLRDLRQEEIVEPLSSRLARILPQPEQQLVGYVGQLVQIGSGKSEVGSGE
jgi:hypothetical protein